MHKFSPTLFQHLATDTARNLVITAGAGTGKTEVLTRRIIKILHEERLSLDRLMVVTFTDKAAVEMKERIYSAIEREIEKDGDVHFKKLKDNFLENRIRTFHAFCAGLLREYPIEAEIDPYFRVMDEVDKVFFLRRVINRSINELAEDRKNPDLSVLSFEWSKSAIANAVYSLIQKRENAGPWMHEFAHLSWHEFKERLPAYQECILREICYKPARSQVLTVAVQLLNRAQPDPPDDDSALSLRRKELLDLVPQLQSLLLSAMHEDFDPCPVKQYRDLVLKACNLRGAQAKAWANDPQALDLLREGIMRIRSALESLNIEDFDINWAVEEEAFAICQALARVATVCLNAYRKEKKRENYLDFQDLQIKILALLKSGKHDHIIKELREKYIYIMVDEFQDTNDLQWNIVRAITSDEGKELLGDRLFIVGDEKQAIYSFRGGDVSLFARVRRKLLESNRKCGTHRVPFNLSNAEGNGKDYTREYAAALPEDRLVRSGEIIFRDNFRSAAVLITFFNLFFHELLSQELYEDYEARPQRLICSGNRRIGSIELLLVDRTGDNEDESLKINDETAGLEDIDVYTKEAHLIATKIKEVLLGDDPVYENVRNRASGGKPAIAILLNRRTKLKIYEEALRRESIDFVVVRGRGFYQRQEIVDLGNLLGLLADMSNSIYLAGFLRSPVGHVSDEGIYALSCLPGGESLWDKLCLLFDGIHPDDRNKKIDDIFQEDDYSSLKRAYDSLLRWHFLSRRMILIDFLHFVLDKGGYYASLARGMRGEQAISNIEKLLDLARDATLSEQNDFLSFAQWLNDRIDYIEEEGEADVDIVLGGAVQLMTVHQSKGLEFPLVFVPDLTASFNFGERETLRFDHVTESLTIDDHSFLRKMKFEIGIDAPDPLKNFEPAPTLIKRIIEKRNREKVIAERKRLFYVASTRAMDHLILVGQLKSLGQYAVQEERARSLNQMRSWMDWLSKILKLTESLEGIRGTITLGKKDGEHLKIPYRLFDENTSMLSFTEELRTEFPLFADDR